MIRYTLTCANAHRFDSWFRSADAYQVLSDAGQLACMTCGSARVTKSVMAPSVTTPKPEPTPLEKFRAHVEATSDDVGTGFAQEARAIHEGRAPERPIIGQANGAEVRDLIADDIPVLPLPFVPRRRTN
ncbi:DUF1178 family protein [Loktanella sp. DJP18]|uniref:DUF1178 family protein n=1 Tax=Loktanella sp. DJP18 TaxID=3409788 RepID=UPI003BB4E6E9